MTIDKKAVRARLEGMAEESAAARANERRYYYLRDFRHGTPVCPYGHDHPGGDGYEDCVRAAEHEFL